jgi:hypothetical protein
MSSAIFTRPENPLTKLVQAPGGLRVGDALEKAAENLSTIKNDCLATIDAQLAELTDLSAEGGAAPTDAVKQQIYATSNDILAVSGVFELAELSQAAYSLCDLIDRLSPSGRWSKPAVDVHLSAFYLLRNVDPESDRSSVLEGLRQVTEQVVG